MASELVFDLSLVNAKTSLHRGKNHFLENDDCEESTESTFYGEDWRVVIDAFFEDESSMYSSSSEESITSSEHGTYTRIFGDEDSLVLSKIRQLQQQQQEESSMCSSSSEESIASREYGTATRTFGDEDSLVLIKNRRQQQEESETRCPSILSSGGDDTVIQAESLLEGRTITVLKPLAANTSGSASRVLLNRRASDVDDPAIELQRGRKTCHSRCRRE